MVVLLRCGVIVLALAAITLADPLNGDFEQGSLNGWTLGGDGSAEAIQSDADDYTIDPISGTWSGFVHNGPGDTGVEGSVGILESSPFIASEWGGNLSFSWDFFTEEFTGPDEHFVSKADFDDGYYGSGLDSYTIELYNILTSTSELLASGNVVDSTFSFLSPAPQSAPESNTGYWEHTGQDTFSRDFGALDAGSYKLIFTVLDGPLYDPYAQESSIWDDWFASGLLIDDVSFLANQPPPPVDPIPEPSTLALVALGGLAAFFARRRRRD